MTGISLSEILKGVEVVQVVGPTDRAVARVDVLGANDDPKVLAWCNEANLPRLAEFHQGVVLVPTLSGVQTYADVTYVVVAQPRLAFLKCVAAHFSPAMPQGVHPTAVIDPSVQVPDSCYVGPHVVIEEGCQIGPECRIDANTVLKRGTILGSRVCIGANCTIGGVGFGYEKDVDGHYLAIPHLGNVQLEDGVEIGNNTAIDRAVMGSTILRRNAKVDNLVHIAHGADIGANALVIAHAMVAGSTKIGESAWIAPCAAIINKTTVGADAVVGMGAVVTKPVPDGDVVVGSPARSIKKP